MYEHDFTDEWTGETDIVRSLFTKWEAEGWGLAAITTVKRTVVYNVLQPRGEVEYGTRYFFQRKVAA